MTQHSAAAEQWSRERYGEHAFTSDFNAEALEFLLSRAQPSTEADLPVCESAGAP